MTPLRVAVIFRSVRPQAGLDAFSAFLKSHVPAAMLRQALRKNDFQDLYEKYGPDRSTCRIAAISRACIRSSCGC